MGLNIKNHETYELAKQVAALTGTSMTAAIHEALQRQLDRLNAQDQAKIAAKVERAMQIVRDSGPSHGMTHKDVDRLLYDEHGLPK